MTHDASDAEPSLGAQAMAADIPPFEVVEGRYLIRFARTPDEIQDALRLRYEVFNLELGEGLDSSHVLGRDEDIFDNGCHHLLVIDTRDDVIVGTYRLQTHAMAARHAGFYSAGEYHLEDLGEEVLNDSVEIGRACVHVEHRKQRVLFGLWKGLAGYIEHTGRRYLFGCCSLTSQDPHEAREVLEFLRAHGHLHPTVHVRALPSFACVDSDSTPIDISRVNLPKLFNTYLRFSARVCSEPALDREFKTIDYLVLMDTATLPEATRQMFFPA
jgi:putative hemolysin